MTVSIHETVFSGLPELPQKAADPPAGTNIRVGRYMPMTDHFSRVSPKTLTSEERKQRDLQRKADAELAMKEHDEAQRAFHANRERLRAERLAREAEAEQSERQSSR